MSSINRRKFLVVAAPTAAATTLSILSACTPNNRKTVSGIVTKRAVVPRSSYSKNTNDNTMKYYIFIDNKKYQVNKKNYDKARIGKWVSIRCGEY